MSTSQMVLILCVQNIAHKNEALHGYVSPRVRPRELYRLEIALKIITTVPRLAPMWQQSGTLLFCSCHGIATFFVDELQI